MTERSFSTFELRSLHGHLVKMLRDSIDMPRYEQGEYSRRNIASLVADIEDEIENRVKHRTIGGGSAPHNPSHT
jgi:hypothetical protein